MNGVFLSPNLTSTTPTSEDSLTPTKPLVMNQVENTEAENLTTPKNEINPDLMDAVTSAPWAHKSTEPESVLFDSTPEPEKKIETNEETIDEEKPLENSIAEESEKKTELETEIKEIKRDSVDDENSHTPKKKLKTDDEEF